MCSRVGLVIENTASLLKCVKVCKIKGAVFISELF